MSTNKSLKIKQANRLFDLVTKAINAESELVYFLEDMNLVEEKVKRSEAVSVASSVLTHLYAEIGREAVDASEGE